MSASTPAILYVDDDRANLQAFRYCFGDRFEIVTAETPEEALELLASHTIGVILADQRMPGMGGAELCGLVRERYPQVTRMVITAYADMQSAVAAVNFGRVTSYICKPWDQERLAATLEAGIQEYLIGTTLRVAHEELLFDEQRAFVRQLAQEIATIVVPAINLGRGTCELLAGRLGSLAAGTEPGRDLGPEIRELANAARAAAEGQADAVAELARRAPAEATSHLANGLLDLAELVRAALEATRGLIAGKARLAIDFRRTPPIVGPASSLMQAVMSLVVAAVGAIPERAAADRVLCVATRAAASSAILEIGCSASPFAEWSEPPGERPPTREALVAHESRDLSAAAALVIAIGGTVEAKGGMLVARFPVLPD